MAVDAYLALAKKYKINCGQLKSFIASSLRAERGDGLLVAVPAMMMMLAEPASDILKTEIEFASQVYKLPVRIEASPSLVKAQQTLERMSDSILMEARKALDWQAILMLNSNLHSDLEYRGMLLSAIFKDSVQLADPNYRDQRWMPAGKMMGMKVIDSLHFTRLHDFIKTKGFPGQSRTGCYSNMMWITMRHALGLLSAENPTTKEKWVSMWKYLVPILYEHAQTGEYPKDWYQYVHKDLVSNKNLDRDMQEYFKKYSFE